MNNFYELLAEKAHCRPARAFITEDRRSFSYGQFLAYADELAARAPARRGDACLILADTFTRQAAAFFAAQKIGARPILLHHGLAAEEERAILRENGLQGLWRLSAEGESYESLEVPQRFVDTRDCLGVLSSGSTGTPKVMYRTYESWAGFFPVQNPVFGVDGDTRMFLHGSLSFTGNMNSFLSALYEGASVVTGLRLGLRAWEPLLRAHRANVLYLVPAKLRLLASAKEPFPDVRSVFTGSQLVTDKLLARLRTVLPNARIVLYYGASELNYITYTELSDAPRDSASLGRPFPGVGVSVRDGMIYVDTPFHVSGAEIPFTVRDMGRMNEKGELVFLGRREAWVNKGGFKISCARVENVLQGLEGVASAAVLPMADEARGDELAAFVVKEPEADEAVVRRAVRKALKPVEMPGRLVFLPELPLNDRGKLDVPRLWVMAGVNND
ncbi:MAG: AMP-binding protein [Schwartzia sp.]|nr:AMP-binding protein [Schwartzia sp. (in: firmicutes)]